MGSETLFDGDVRMILPVGAPVSIQRGHDDCESLTLEALRGMLWVVEIRTNGAVLFHNCMHLATIEMLAPVSREHP